MLQGILRQSKSYLPIQRKIIQPLLCKENQKTFTILFPDGVCQFDIAKNFLTTLYKNEKKLNFYYHKK